MERDIIARYIVESDDMISASKAIAIGQSFGNPTVRSGHETPEMWERYVAEVESVDKYRVQIRYPKENFEGEHSLSFILSVLLGGQADIDSIKSCVLVDADLPEEIFPGPKFGIDGIREKTTVWNKPLIGGILKPKNGITPELESRMCKEMAEGGVNFIKEDEVLGSDNLAERVERVAEVLKPYFTLFAPVITGDYPKVFNSLKTVEDKGATAFHCNIWSGFGILSALARESSLPFFFQKSGDKVWTTGPFSISFVFLCKLVRLIGADFMHVGMWGGYMNEDEEEIRNRLDALCGNWTDKKPVLPSFSCGAHPGLVRSLVNKFGSDIMISAGGSIHGHPSGTRAGVTAFHDAIHGRRSKEYKEAIELWGEK